MTDNVIKFPTKDVRDAMCLLKDYARHAPPFNPQAAVHRMSPDKLKERSDRKFANFTFAYGIYRPREGEE